MNDQLSWYTIIEATSYRKIIKIHDLEVKKWKVDIVFHAPTPLKSRRLFLAQTKQTVGKSCWDNIQLRWQKNWGIFFWTEAEENVLLKIPAIFFYKQKSKIRETFKRQLWSSEWASLCALEKTRFEKRLSKVINLHRWQTICGVHVLLSIV